MKQSAGHEEVLERLDHLISFASHLILLSTPVAEDRTEVVETYLEHYSADAQKVYLRPSKHQSNDMQKELLIRQIVADAHFKVAKPLHDTIFRLLGDQQKQLLIVIDNAHNLPDKLVTELWNLILQNQFAHDKHHINIILSAEPEWITNCQKNIPYNGNEKPICIDLPDSRPEQQQWLEKVARAKRNELQQQKDNAEKQLTAIKTKLKRSPKNFNWVLKLSAVGSLMVATGLYGLNNLYQLDSASLQEFNAFLLQQDKTQSASLSRYQQLMQPGVNKAPKVSKNENSADITGLQKVEQLVSDWNPKEPAFIERASQPQSQPLPEKSETETVKLQPPEQFTQLPKTPEKVINVGKINADNHPPPAPKDIPSLPFDNEEVLKMSADNFTLQLSGLSSLQVLEEFLIEHQLSSEVLVYQTSRNDQPWWVVIYGEFDTLAQARSATSRLPNAASDLQPWAKSLAAVHKEIQQ